MSPTINVYDLCQKKILLDKPTTLFDKVLINTLRVGVNLSGSGKYCKSFTEMGDM